MERTVEMEWLAKLPKLDLHLHLDGSLRPETVIELAGEQGIELPTYDKEELLPYMQVGHECGSLTEYLSKFHFTTRFLQTGKALERAAYEVLEQSAAQRCKYVEVRFAPQLHRNKGLSVEEAIDSVIRGLRRGEAHYGVKAKVIAICMRNHSTKDNMEVVEAAAQFVGKGLGAVDLAGDEAAYRPELFRDVFKYSQKRGIPATIHAGEAAGAENVQEAVMNLGANRIGHGVRLKENPHIMDMVIKRGIPLEMCPISNIQTKAVSDWDAYPVREYFDNGLRITINTDNPGVSGTNITKEYQVLMEKFGFTLREIVTLIKNGLAVAFLDDQEKKALHREFQAELDTLPLNAS